MAKSLTTALMVSMVAFASLAYGGEERTVDMTQIIYDEQDQPAKDFFMALDPTDKKCPACPTLTFGAAIAHALAVVTDEDSKRAPALLADMKWSRYELGRRLMKDTNAKLTANEIVVIKNQLGLLYGGIILAQIYPVLDPNKTAPEVKP